MTDDNKEQAIKVRLNNNTRKKQSNIKPVRDETSDNRPKPSPKPPKKS